MMFSIFNHNKIKQIAKRFGRIVLFFLCSVIAILVIIDQVIAFYVRQDIYTDIEHLPHRPYAVVLGTSKYVAKNRLNLYYYNRLIAAQKLFNKKKVDYLLLSGDNRTNSYNEPRMMFQDLRKMGVAEQFMYMDFAGFRTLDSIVRADQVFQAKSFTIISQQFHCERALFIAKYHNIDAICFAADYPDQIFLVRLREIFARSKAVWDILMEKEPHFLGKPEPLPPPATVPILKD